MVHLLHSQDDRHKLVAQKSCGQSFYGFYKVSRSTIDADSHCHFSAQYLSSSLSDLLSLHCSMTYLEVGAT